MTTLEYSSFTSNDDENVLFRSESSLPVKKKRKTLSFGTLLPQCLTLSFLVAIIITFTVISTSYIAALSEQNNDSSTQENNLNRIRNITQYAWASYRKFAWPVSGTSGNFIFSAMSTLYLMDLQMEFSEGRRWIEHEFNFAEFDGFVKVHDVITNHLGGLLSLYGLTSDTLFLKKSIEVGDVLLKQAFNPKTGFLYDKINPKQKTFQDFSNSMPISQSGYYQPELILLGQLTNNSILFDHLQKIATQRNHFWTKNDTKQANEKPVKDIFHNLLCSYILSDRRDIVAISLLNSTISFTVEYSFKHKLPNALTYSLNNLLHREHFNETLLFAQDCALGALLTISATEINHFNNTIRDPIKRHYFNKYFKAGVNITKTCHRALRMTKKLPFEFTVHEGVVSSFNGTNSAFLAYFTESIFSLWRQTGNKKYLNFAKTAEDWVFKEAFSSEQLEPTLFSGTLKYLYLTFADESVISLDQYVFNELGHPLPILCRHPVYPAEYCKNGLKVFNVISP